MQSKNKTIYRKDYQLPDYTAENCELIIEILESYTITTSKTIYKKNNKKNNINNNKNLILDGQDLDLVYIKINNQEVTEKQYNKYGDGLEIAALPDRFELEIQCKIYPKNNTSLMGLYCVNNIYCTQCEADGFRKITYYQDRPDVMAIFTTTIIADKTKYPVLLSNGNKINETENSVTWHDPFKKPSYLFAMVAGDLSCVNDSYLTKSNRKINLEIYVQQQNRLKCQHALDSLKKAMAWDEEQFGLEYDLDTYMILAIDEFNMGAMENKGLNIFNSQYVLADPESATDDDYFGIEKVIGHEYFHNWTGNRVTCQDWFQLTLKEGLTVYRDQEFSCDMNSRDLCRVWDIRALQNQQFPEDNSAMAHAIRPDHYQQVNNFYTATVYNKGAEIIRMLEKILGKNGFRLGMDEYFKRYDGMAVTCDEFISAMEGANNIDLSQFRSWYSQVGTPEIEIESDYNNKTCLITINQKNNLVIPMDISFIDENGNENNKKVITIKKQNQTIEIENIGENNIPVFFSSLSAPVKYHYSYSTTELLHIFKYSQDGFVRLDMAERIFTGMLEDKIKLDDYIINLSFILDNNQINSHMRSEILSFPNELFLLDYVKENNLTNLIDSRKNLIKNIAIKLQDLFYDLYSECHASPSVGNRALKNKCLDLLLLADFKKYNYLAEAQFNTAKNMTDSIAALQAITNSDLTTVCLEQFYHKWQDTPLVLDKWFRVQGLSRKADLDIIKKLLNHPKFDYKEPNRVRAVLGAFCNSNFSNFHGLAEQGYDFLREEIIKIDKLNPQLAARLLTPFTHWKKFPDFNKALIKSQWERLAQHPDLSNNVKEFVENNT